MRGAVGQAFTRGTSKLVWDVVSRSLTFAITLVLARNLGAEGYGTYAMYWYGAWMLSQITDLGLHLATIRALAQEPSRRLLLGAALAKTLTTLVAVALLPIALSILETRGRLLFFLLLAQLIGSWVESFGAVLRSRGRIAREGTLLSILRACWLVTAIFAVRSYASLETLGLALTVSSLPALVVGIRWMYRFHAATPSGDQPAVAHARGLMQKAAPLAVTSLITLLYLRADLFLVAAISGAREAGLFQSSFRIFEATIVVSGGISAGIFPLLAERLHTEDFAELARFVLSALLGLGLALSVALFTLSERVISLVYGSAFMESAASLSILALGLVPLFVNALTTHLLVAAGRSRRLMASMLVRLATGVVADVLLVPTMGARGAAVGVVCAEWGLTLVSLAFSADLIWPAEARAEESPCA